MSSIARSLPRGGASSANAGDRRKKQIVLVGGLLLVVLVAFQVLRLGGGSSLDASPASAVEASDPTTAALPTSGTATSGAGATFASSPAFRRAVEKMPAKDPFVPLVPGSSSGEASPSPVGETGTAVPETSNSAAKAADTPPIGFSAPDPATPKVAPLPPPTAAIISVNGSSQTVGRSKVFPAKAPAFRLVTVDRAFVRIAVAGGSFTRGRATITIRRGRGVTLVNTATGVRYVLRFAAPSKASVEPATPAAGEK